jgi:hypothetical protein
MGHTLIPRYLAALELSTQTDDELHTLAGDIGLAAKTSALVLGNTQMQASVAAVATSDTALATANQMVDDDHTKLRIDIAAQAFARSDLLGAIRTYGSFVAGGAKSPADVHAAGLPPLGPRPARNTPPTVPVIINNKAPKTGHGTTTVSVGDNLPTRHQYVAQQSLDGGTTWAQLGVGHGTTRVVTGASGTKVWVRFAMVRGQLQSDWCTPVMVTIP